jgi:aryl-alcohol dehydrogenase-like predicted oxidoreductase
MGYLREAGINFFDTADVYGDGASEEIVGTLIAECRDATHHQRGSRPA